MIDADKKIRLVVGINDFRVGGAQKVVADTVRGINQDRFDIHLMVLADSKDEETLYEMIPPSVHIHKLQFSGFNDKKSWRELYRLLKVIKPDIVWSHLYFSNTVFRVLKIILGYKVITVEHNTYLNKTFLQKLVDWFLALFTYKIVVVSDHVADFTAKQEYISRKKFVTILNGVDVSLHKNLSASVKVDQVKVSLGFRSEDKVIISVGQLIRQKNHSLLIDAFSEFKKNHHEYKLIILGEGALRSELENKISLYGLKDDVKLLGIQKDTTAFYTTSDFFVLPSLFEGFALVCIEAMACGLPVISTKVAGPDIYISENQDGLFFDGLSTDLVEKMNLLANMDPVSKEKMRRNAREKADTYNISSTVKNYERLFGEAHAR